jgi:hypothetical protein
VDGGLTLVVVCWIMLLSCNGVLVAVVLSLLVCLVMIGQELRVRVDAADDFCVLEMVDVMATRRADPGMPSSFPAVLPLLGYLVFGFSLLDVSLSRARECVVLVVDGSIGCTLSGGVLRDVDWLLLTLLDKPTATNWPTDCLGCLLSFGRVLLRFVWLDGMVDDGGWVVGMLTERLDGTLIFACMLLCIYSTKCFQNNPKLLRTE